MKADKNVQERIQAMDDQGPKHPWEGPANEIVPAVRADDLKAAWRLVHDTRKEHSGVIAIGRGTWQQVLSKGADIDAVAYRNAMLGLLFQIFQDANLAFAEPEVRKQGDRFSKFNDDKFNDALFRVMSQIRLYWLRRDGPTSGFPFDLEEFLTQLEQASPAS